MKPHTPIFTLVSKLIFFIGRILLSVRYKVEMKGTKLLKDKKTTLFLPNHQAIVDPVLFITHIYRHTTCVPVITSGYYDMPVAKYFFKKWGAVRVSDLEKGSRNTKVLEEITTSVNNGFRHGNNVVLYPAGQLPAQGYEKIMNKQSAFRVVRNMPDDVRVVGVRISGLWGSIWSKAWTGESPDFFPVLLRCIGYTLANLIFFTPMRKVTIEFEDITEKAEEKARHDRQTFNSYLETFYNIHGEEKPLFLKHIFYLPAPKRELPKHIKGAENTLKDSAGNTNRDFPPDIVKKVK